MIVKGRLKYVPKIVLIELDDIKREDDIFADAEAFRKIVKYARVGRELNRLKNVHYDWSKKARLPPVEFNKRKKGKSLFGDIL